MFGKRSKPMDRICWLSGAEEVSKMFRGRLRDLKFRAFETVGRR